MRLGPKSRVDWCNYGRRRVAGRGSDVRGNVWRRLGRGTLETYVISFGEHWQLMGNTSNVSIINAIDCWAALPKKGRIDCGELEKMFRCHT